MILNEIVDSFVLLICLLVVCFVLEIVYMKSMFLCIELIER